jgi:hypothetical protein
MRKNRGRGYESGSIIIKCTICHVLLPRSSRSPRTVKSKITSLTGHYKRLMTHYATIITVWLPPMFMIESYRHGERHVHHGPWRDGRQPRDLLDAHLGSWAAEAYAAGWKPKKLPCIILPFWKKGLAGTDKCSIRTLAVFSSSRPKKYCPGGYQPYGAPSVNYH